MKPRVRTPEEPFDRSLLEPGREAEALAAIAERYRQSQELTYNGPRGATDFHRTFAQAILDRNPRAIDYLANGLNDVGKAVFSDVTGISLPPQQGKTWEALMAWGGITPAQDALYHAERRLVSERRHLERLINNVEAVAAEVQQRIDLGFTRIALIDRRYWMINGEGAGYDLSARGSGWAKCRDYIDAAIEVHKAQQAVAAEQPAPELEQESEPLLSLDVDGCFSMDH